MKKGEIYRVKKEHRVRYNINWYEHHFVYWGETGNDLDGIMLTSSDQGGQNILLEEYHIESGYKFKYRKSTGKRTFIVPAFLLKSVNYSHLRKTGMLTQKGIDFLESISNELPYTDWFEFEED